MYIVHFGVESFVLLRDLGWTMPITKKWQRWRRSISCFFLSFNSFHQQSKGFEIVSFFITDHSYIFEIRQEVFAYSNYSNYEIQVHQTSESNATMLVSNFWNSETLSLFQQHGYSYVTVLGYQVSQHITQPNQLLTNSKLVYKENSISEGRMGWMLDEIVCSFWLVFCSNCCSAAREFYEADIDLEFREQ